MFPTFPHLHPLYTTYYYCTTLFTQVIHTSTRLCKASDSLGASIYIVLSKLTEKQKNLIITPGNSGGQHVWAQNRGVV